MAAESVRRERDEERFLDEDFLLDSKTAVDLYEGFARRQPIIDYHNHLPPRQIADDHRFRSLTEIWLDGDHYKWRAMRAAGRPRARHHRRRVRLGEVRGLGRDRPPDAPQPALSLDAPRARVPVRRHGQAARPRHRARDLRPLQPPPRPSGSSPPRGCCGSTTCGSSAAPTIRPTISRPTRATPRTRAAFTKLYPTWRPDRALAVHDLAAWNAWVDKLGAAADVAIDDLAALRDALARRHAFFHARGCRASDHGLDRIYAAPYTEREVEAIFAKARAGKALAPDEIEKFRSALLLRLRRDGPRARLGAAVPPRGHAQPERAGRAPRSARTPATTRSATSRQGEALARFLDRLDAEDRLAKTIVYNLNPADNELVATIIGSFQDGSVAREDAVRQRLVVPRSARRHGAAARRAVEHGPALPLRRHADRLAQLPVVLAARLLPPPALQPARQRRRARAPAERPRAARPASSRTSASATCATSTSASTSRLCRPPHGVRVDVLADGDGDSRGAEGVVADDDRLGGLPAHRQEEIAARRGERVVQEGASDVDEVDRPASRGAGTASGRRRGRGRRCARR